MKISKNVNIIENDKGREVFHLYPISFKRKFLDFNGVKVKIYIKGFKSFDENEYIFMANIKKTKI